MKHLLQTILFFVVLSTLEAKSLSQRLDHNIQRRNVVKSPTEIWPGGVVPYLIDGRNFTPQMYEILEESIKFFENYTCIRFLPRQDGQRDYVVIRGPKDFGCSSPIGLKKGIQYLNLDPRFCFKQSTRAPIHEMLHVLGFYHQQSAPNRDDHLTIISENIIESMISNFEKKTYNETTDFGLPYDFESIMQYDNAAFGKNFDKYGVEVEMGEGKPLWTSMAKVIKI